MLPQLLALLGSFGLIAAAPSVAAAAQAVPDATVTTAASTTQAVVTPADPFAQAMAARGVADYARRAKDATAMIVAARMLSEIPINDDSAQAEVSKDAGFSVSGLLAEARTLAKGDAVLLTQIRVIESGSTRGVSASGFGRGLVRSVRTMTPRGLYQFNVTARGGETLRIGAIGDVGTALMIRMLDATGRVVCVDDQDDYAPVCQLKPKAAGQYRVDLMNKSAASSRAVILSN